ncbi:Cd2-binding protein-like protein [Thalictrum thalictroides]|uniref:Cd2-binding protein-like protein n=1 Tax=Thalictrum thalictroides TaxID=46969 RepID=A0A7J6XEC1_THATH|nr:Cd2-binding protein-like protein [Thalictrum thalictroides]
MEEKGSRKRSLPEDEDEDDSTKPPMAKRMRFPKGKKVKNSEGETSVVIGASIGPQAPVDLTDPKVAAEERVKRRVQNTNDLFTEESSEIFNVKDISIAEEDYEDEADFVDGGIKIEPFNLNEERKEGYFDADGNFVEYASEKEAKDAWLDSVEVDSRFAGKNSGKAIEEDIPDLSEEDIKKMMRRIADLLLPEETVLQALRRLKGKSTDRKAKMSEEVKLMFDQLTEYSMKLMENGETDIYHEKRRFFEHEAGRNAAEDFDMFAEDDENPTLNPSTNDIGLDTGSASESHSLPSTESAHTSSENGDAQNDYVYDESSGYYYNSTVGYYYDPASGLYCSANTGIWYSYNEQTGIYEEIHGETENFVK